MSKPARMKAEFIRMALKEYYAAPEHAIVYEVAKATGFDANRHIDAIAMDLWPSRGLTVHGIEIKVSLADWRREKANPEKAEELAQFCDLFWIAAPEGLIPRHEIPHAWGLLEVSGAGRVKVAQAGTKTDAVDIGRPFVAALLRAATRPTNDNTLDAMLARRQADFEDNFDTRVKLEAERISAAQDTDAVNWRRLVENLGEDPSRRFQDEDFAKAVKAVWKSGAAQTFTGLRHIPHYLTEAAEKVGAALADIGIEAEEKPKRRRKSV